MKFKPIYILLFSSILSQSNAQGNTNQDKLKKIKTLSTFIFASCNKESLPQPLWPSIINDKAQLFIWGGDSIYGDKKPFKNNLVKKFNQVKMSSPYQKLRNQTAIIGTWDDHDFGINNGNHTYAKKDLSKKAYLDFLDEPLTSPRRKRSGVYISYTFGEVGQQVKIILLDNRYNLSKKRGILGAEQRDWLTKELKDSRAQIHFIVSGMPILPSSMFWTEEWSDYPASKKFLFNIVEKYNVPGLIFLSGDKHFAAITKKNNYIEVMSSGMTHKASKIFRPLLRKRFKSPSFHLNYAYLKIDWDKKPIELSVAIKGIKKTSQKHTFKLEGQFFR